MPGFRVSSEMSASRGASGEVFEPFRDPAVFAQVPVDPELGAIAWPNGLDMLPSRSTGRHASIQQRNRQPPVTRRFVAPPPQVPRARSGRLHWPRRGRLKRPAG
jgi:hypothetical protein